MTRIHSERSRFSFHVTERHCGISAGFLRPVLCTHSRPPIIKQIKFTHTNINKLIIGKIKYIHTNLIEKLNYIHINMNTYEQK